MLFLIGIRRRLDRAGEESGKQIIKSSSIGKNANPLELADFSKTAQ